MEDKEKDKDKEKSKKKKMKVKIKDYDKLKTVGLGSYGRVRLCKNKKTGAIYVMKILKKNEIIKQKQVDHVYSEFNILSMLKHPFIVQLLGYNFEDPYSPTSDWMLPSNTMPTNSPARFTTGLPELPPMMSAVETKLHGVVRSSALSGFFQDSGRSKSPS